MLKKVRHVIVWVAKGVGAIAVVALILAPITNNGVLVMVVAASVALGCFFVISTLSDLDDWPFNSEDGSGYWPKKPER